MNVIGAEHHHDSIRCVPGCDHRWLAQLKKATQVATGGRVTYIPVAACHVGGYGVVAKVAARPTACLCYPHPNHRHA